MKTKSLEFACEEFFLKLFRADSRLAGKTLVHFDDERKAKSNAIIVQAKQGNHQLAANGGFEVEVIVEYRSPIGTTKAVNDLVATAIRDVIYGSVAAKPRATIARRIGFSDLLIKDETTGDRQNSQDLRKRTITFPLQAKIM